MFNISNLINDKPLFIAGYSKSTGKCNWRLNNFSAWQVSADGEIVTKTDNTGTAVASFNRAKSVEMSGESTFYNLDLLAAQNGTKKKVGSSDNKIIVPAYKVFDTTTGQTKVVLDYTPIGTSGAEIKYIYEYNLDNSPIKEFEIAATADATHFALDAETKTITLPTGLPTGTRIGLDYERESEDAIEVNVSAIEFPIPEKVIVAIKTQDTCGTKQSVLFYEFPNAQMTVSSSVSHGTEDTHPFSLTCAQDYCSLDKRLYRVVVPSEVPADFIVV